MAIAGMTTSVVRMGAALILTSLVVGCGGDGGMAPPPAPAPAPAPVPPPANQINDPSNPAAGSSAATDTTIIGTD
jgi:hypothetical protein